jgi:hypothetical protein
MYGNLSFRKLRTEVKYTFSDKESKRTSKSVVGRQRRINKGNTQVKKTTLVNLGSKK